MTHKVPYPAGIRGAAYRFGRDIGTHADLSKFGFDLNAGGSIKVDSSGVHTTASGKTYSAPEISQPTTTPLGTAPTPRAAFTTPAFTAVKQPAVKARAPVALKLPLTIDPNVALAVADKLLGDPKVKNGAEVVANTISLAQVPHDRIDPADHAAIVNSAAIIDAAQQIRQQTGAAPGQPAIPVIGPGEAAAVDTAAAASAYPLTSDDIAALLAAPPEVAPHISVWKRFFNWLASF